MTTTPTWSDGLYLDGLPPTSEDVPYGDMFAYKMLPLSGDRCLVVYEWEQANRPLANPDGWYSLRARVVSAGDPPTGGGIVIVDNLEATLVDLFGPRPDTNWRTELFYAFGLSQISENRAVLVTVGGRSFFDDATRKYRKKTYAAVTLLTIDGTTVRVQDRWFDTQDSAVTGREYTEYPTSVAISGGRVAAFIPDRDSLAAGFGGDTYATRCRIVSVVNDALVVGAAQSTPIGIGDGGAWANPDGTVGVVLGYSPTSPQVEQLYPFTVQGDILTFTPVHFTDWPRYAELNAAFARWQFFNEGIPAQGPEPNQFLMPVGDHDNTNDYLSVAVMETDGTTVTFVAESLGYNDDAGFGYPDAWLPSVTYGGKVVSLYSAGRARYDDPDPLGGGHGHQHAGDPVLLIDSIGKTSYDDVTEAQMPRTGTWALLAQDSGFWIRDLAATESGVFVAVGGYADSAFGNQPTLIGWVRLAGPPVVIPTIDPNLVAELRDIGQSWGGSPW